MNRKCIKGLLCVFVVSLMFMPSTQVWADDPFLTYSSLFTEKELDKLLAPIALYPDPLLAQMLPASTYPAEIVDARVWLRSGGTTSGIDRQNWDESVKAIAYYPSILNMMADNIEWTADVGDAFLNQPEDVSRSIQRLRRYARDAGNLVSTSQQTVIDNGYYIEIIPAQPPYIYVPQYDPSVIYVQRWVPGGVPFITFGLGLVIGGWLTLDFDWSHHHVIYHGWNRSGWVNHARPYIRIKNVYINRSRPYIRQTWRHNASHGSPERYRALHPPVGPSIRRNARMPEIRGSVTIPPKPMQGVFGPRGDAYSYSNRGKASRKAISIPPTKPTQDLKKQPTKPVPGISRRPAPRTPDISQKPLVSTPSISKQPSTPAPVVRKGTPQIRPPRESLQTPRTPSVTFGGYRGDQEARGQSIRGQASRKNIGSPKSPAVFERKSGTHEGMGGVKGSPPAGKGDIKGRMRR